MLRVQGPACSLGAVGIYLMALPERSPRMDEGRLPDMDITGVKTAPEVGSWAFVQWDGPHCGCLWSQS